MKFVSAAICLVAMTGVAIAAGPSDCVKISIPSDRLACFDKIFVPEKKVADPKKELHDNTIDENTHLDKSMRSICKGCLKR